MKDIELEKVKLERVLPLLEEINGAIYEHRMLFNSYVQIITNKGVLPRTYEEERVKIDERLIKSISSIGIYIPPEFRKLLWQIRVVVSCSFNEANSVYKVLKDLGSPDEVLGAVSDLYNDIYDCFHEMVASYVNLAQKDIDYFQILKNHHLDKDSKTVRETPSSVLAYKFILAHEIYGSGEQVAAQVAYQIDYEKNTQ